MNERSILIEDPQIAAFLSQQDPNQPVAMLNLLKFRDTALYPENIDEKPCTGETAYGRYAELVRPILTAMGARIMCVGVAWMIGPPGEWDRAFVARYERCSDIVKLGIDPAYMKVAHHRTAALVDSRLLMMQFSTDGQL